MELTGTSGEDTLQGTTGNDTIYGLDGTDVLRGDAGDDYLVGGAETGMDGSDSIYGDIGNDTLIGGADDDYLFAGAGDDVLEGGTGNDDLYPASGNNVSHGGDGNDRFTLMQATDTVHGGAGDDWFGFLGDPAVGQTILNGGDGNDTIHAVWGTKTAGSTIRVTGGTGNDTFSFSGYAGAGWTGVHPLTVTIADFTQGSDIVSLAFTEAPSFPGNPFGPLGYLRLEQRGANTVIQYDRDGAAGTSDDFYDAVILEGVTATDLDRHSFAGYLDPSGSSIGANVTGTEEVDRLEGGPLHDTFYGGDGSDYLLGGSGNDLLVGGDEAGIWGGGDNLRGGNGTDTLEGGGGNDQLHGGEGNDLLAGGTGNDTLLGDPGNDLLDGGDGDDLLADSAGDDSLFGGAGDDQIYSQGSADSYIDGGDGSEQIFTGIGADTVLGGAGDDLIYVGEPFVLPDIPRMVPTLVDGGDGADVVYFQFNGANRVIVTGGAGPETYAPYSIFAAVAEITDFAPGLGGDVIDFRYWDPSFSERDLDPFGPAGFARAVQMGADTAIEMDRDGAIGTGFGFEQVFLLRGVTATDLSSDNFMGAAPDTAPPGLQLNGNPDADVLVGSAGEDILVGNGGSDRLEGAADDDHLDGGVGNDLLIGGAGDDTMMGGAGFDHARFEGSFFDFEVTPTTVTDTRGLGTDTLAGIERLVFDDARYAFDIEGVGGAVYRLYQAAFNRTPDLAGLGYWIGAGDRGLPLVDMSAMFFESPEFKALYGASQSNEELVRLFYVNALHRQPDEPGVLYWTALLDEGNATPAMILTGFSESAENKAATATVIGNGFQFDPTFY